MSIYAMKATPPDAIIRRAYNEGVDAARVGKSWKDNPYPSLSLQHLAWANGHMWGRG